MKPSALFLMDEVNLETVYGAEGVARAKGLVDFPHPPQTAQSIRGQMHLLKNVEVIMSSWGMSVLDEAFLKAAPKLRAIFYAAGTIRYFFTEAAWDRGVVICTASEANAVPVAEFTLAQIILAAKGAWPSARQTHLEGRLVWAERSAGMFGSTIGIISLGLIGRMVCQRLGSFDVKVIAYDPMISLEMAERLGVELCSLEDVFARSDVVSLHAPLLDETRHMIRGSHFSKMKPGAAFINTARGAVVFEEEMIQVLRERPDLTAYLDVTDPEPPKPGSPLFELPNVFLTPHIAGSREAECRRMGKYMLDELECWLKNEPLRWRLSREQAARTA